MTETILVTGSTGYVGGRLVPLLLEAGYDVRCLARNPEKLRGRPWFDAVAVVAGDLRDSASILHALDGVDRAYYLAHSMGVGDDFVRVEREAASVFAAAATEKRLRQIVYLGGLGEDDGELSPHLAGRQEVGRILATGTTPVTELRSGVILGSGSASFEMLRALVEVIPLMVTPRWVNVTRCQPIGIADVLAYLVGVLGRDAALGRVFEIGGPDVLTYRQLMDIYAEEAGLPRRLVIPVPVLSPLLSSHWVNLVTPLPIDLARPLIEGLRNDVVVRDTSIRDIVPITPESSRDAIRRALARIGVLDIPTAWSGASRLDGVPAASEPALPDPADPSWAGGTLFRDRRRATTTASPTAVMAVLSTLGGDTGWLVGGPLWRIRGRIDKLIGGVGLRRGRRHPRDLRVGDVVDFFRVEAMTDRLLRLRAEMRTPGHAWLQWDVSAEGGTTTLNQSAIFAPKGLFGRVYWAVLMPFHAFIFGRMIDRVVALAETPAP